MLIAIIAIVAGCSIPITAILTAHARATKRLQLQLIDREIELERIKLETYSKETEKLTIELERARHLLLEDRKG